MKGTNLYLDVAGAANKNGTNVMVYNGNGTIAQVFNVQKVDLSRHKIIASCAPDKVLDVYRGASIKDSINAGDNIDIYINNDWQAQEWFFTKTYDGYYSIRLNTVSNCAITASSATSGANVLLGEYGDNDLQKWKMISTTVPASAQAQEPNLRSASYTKPTNPFANANLYGQCTWYAWGRAKEVKGISLPTLGDGKTWLSTAKSKGYSTGMDPRANSIAVWSNGDYGHVAYVEKVDGSNVTITESNWGKYTWDNKSSIEDGIYYYSGSKTLTTAQMKVRSGQTLIGYIYLQ